ncbi:DUF1178 family protein [Psychromarinibacter sp. C21-152]|uniref:DUF1178 family protein n=1 Tax=Psychromarinibacter sediminicola TaxID=3033385 RepID=A0AAE3T864_9RHOB|nr:DUF1178 family protein [Psychromarinibacter sediminicola]MDF0600413.1 DUF1178 family protein [Psychromarinibacter sediminicola]
MIRYTLRCPDDHRFESWFASAEAFETLQASGMVACPDCGSAQVEKSLMTPGVRTARKAAAPPAPAEEKTAQTAPAERPLAAPSSELEAKLAELRRHVEKTSDYVGLGFAAEARRMHDGEIPHRSIYGEAKPDEARKLIEDGVPVAPLPFRPTRKSN